MDDPAHRFQDRLWQSVHISIALGYRPSIFIRMLEQHGGVRTAKRLIASGEIQSGIRKMAELGRLDITMERIMLEPEFAPLFTKGALEAGAVEAAVNRYLTLSLVEITLSKYRYGYLCVTKLDDQNGMECFQYEKRPIPPDNLHHCR